MKIELQNLGNVDKVKLESFLFNLKKEYEHACSLNETKSLIDKLLNEQSSNMPTCISIDYGNAIAQEHTVQMLQLRDRILKDIRCFFTDIQQ